MRPLTDHLDALLADAAPERSWQHVIRQSRLFVVVWSDQVRVSPDMLERLAYANAVGTPIRLLLADATRIPEDAFLDLADVEVARAETPEAAQAQLETWLAALPRNEERCV